MKIRFIVAPKGRDYKIDQVAEFKGKIEEGYARKYVARGWAVEIDEAAERKERARQAAEAKTAARGDVEIPQGYADLNYVELRMIAGKLSDDAVGSKADAIKVIEAELARRAGDQQPMT